MKTLKEDVCFIGVGGAGTNIANTFERSGYEAIMINSSEQDLRSLKGAKIIRKLNGVNGCAGDRRLAKKALAQNQEVIDEIENLPQDILFICFSVAGGTGSGLGPVLAEIIAEDTDKTVCCICVLPERNEELIRHENAIKCAQEFLEMEGLGAIFFVDNNYGSKLLVNDEIHRALNLFISNNSASEKGNVDEQEKRRMLASPGSMVIRTVSRENDSAAIGSIMHTASVFAPIQTDHICTYIAVINYATRQINPDLIISQVGTPRQTLTGYGAGTNIIAVSGLTYPIDHINEIGQIAKRLTDERAAARSEARKTRLASFEFEEDETSVRKPEKIEKKSARDRMMALLKD